MRFGLFIPQGWRMDLVGIDPAQQWEAMAGLAAYVDDGDVFESIWVYDHFHTVPIVSDEATHEAWTLMSALAVATGRIRLGQMCTCVSYRNPAYLAKVAATVDVISGGRLEMGIGGGWYEKEWRAYGYGFPSAGERLGRLREGVQIFRDMWTTGSATLDGRHYQVEGARCAPRPLQGTSAPGSEANGIPIWVAGGGEKVTLRIAAQYADYTNFYDDADTFSRKSDVLRGHCREIGRDFDSIVRTGDFNVVIGETEADVEDRLRFHADLLRRGGVPEPRIERQIANLRTQPAVGTPERIVEVMRDMEQRGMGYAILYFQEAAHDRSGIELFENTVAAELRG
ncbi:MAG TPA: LLM class F420-dependent oxidoreductase [Intrasporangium sp.]|uniref:LLM class F420-dependent oxidoreductase n=1 Tax=Intrasporangium sp. TaxID=1925024 RepID=UPI002B474683|nr:LLM class F420-dependent oxidoreductase [Intrasporangium sp.]HKX68350.1 LLM class F420-dependent oxidoreductase [Intrasporangium sp.]